MSEPERGDGGGLQFDRADFGTGAAPALACANCAAPIASAYYETGGKTICEACRYTLEAFMESRAGVGGAVKAVLAGLGAAIAGGVLYYAVLALSGYEFGLIAIVVGYLVGRAVRWGSGNRGGAFYQAVAVVLTYVAIVGCYVPLIVREVRARAQQEAAAAQQQPPGSGGQYSATGTPGGGQNASRAEAPGAGVVQGSTAGDPEAPRIGAFRAFGLFALFVLALPFLQGFQNILGLLIIGFGLYQAWKLNRRVRLVFDGPFTPGRTASA
ncbi:MAG: hypothetical protein EHM24_04310 [Acidobacteria bacterium]|nr:MAG: hypothetical protein EHM24_04310 [Acidobacteriota bacterium]